MREQPGNYPGQGMSSDDMRRAQANVQQDANQMQVVAKCAIPSQESPFHLFFKSGSLVSVRNNAIWAGLGVIEPYNSGCGPAMACVLMVTGKMKGQKGYFFAPNLQLLHGTANIHHRLEYYSEPVQTPTVYGF